MKKVEKDAIESTLLCLYYSTTSLLLCTPELLSYEWYLDL